MRYSLSRKPLSLLPALITLSLITGCASKQPSSMPDTYSHKLTCAKGNHQVDDWRIDSSSVSTPGTAAWSVSHTTLHGGKQEGVSLIEIDNGVLQIRVIPTRGMSVLDITKGDIRLGWDSPVKEVVHPSYVDHESRGGLGWLEGFNEWMVRCGLEYAGHPGRDEFVTNTGGTAQMDLTLHGKIGNIPASSVEVVVDKEPPHRIRVRGTVNERMFYGPKLELTTEISTVPGSSTFRIEDKVTNHGSGDQEIMLIYHANYGSSILEEGAQLVAAAKQVTPMNDHAAKATSTYPTYAAPTKDFVEEVFLITPYADDNGNTTIMLKNAAGDVGTSIAWSVKQLPYLTQWKNTAANADGYVTGLEPGTCHPFNRKVERKFGRVAKLAADQTRSFALDFGIHEGEEAVNEVAEKIAGIQNNRPTTVDESAPTIPE